MTLSLRPYLPPGWENLRVTHIPVGSALVDISVRRNAKETVYAFRRRSERGSGKSRGFVSLVFEPLFPLGTTLFGTFINGKRIQKSSHIRTSGQHPRYVLKLERSMEIRIPHRLGVALVVESPHLIKGQSSSGLRIVEESWRQKTYEVVLEGSNGQEYLTDIYDPSESVKGVEGGIALAREGSRLLVSVAFAGGSAAESYVRKSLRPRT